MDKLHTAFISTAKTLDQYGAVSFVIENATGPVQWPSSLDFVITPQGNFVVMRSVMIRNQDCWRAQ